MIVHKVYHWRVSLYKHMHGVFTWTLIIITITSNHFILDMIECNFVTVRYLLCPVNTPDIRSKIIRRNIYVSILNSIRYTYEHSSKIDEFCFVRGVIIFWWITQIKIFAWVGYGLDITTRKHLNEIGVNTKWHRHVFPSTLTLVINFQLILSVKHPENILSSCFEYWIAWLRVSCEWNMNVK